MTKFKAYPKIRSFGYSGTEQLLNGEIVIQPKVDGSNVSIWKCDEGLVQIGKRTSFLTTKFDDSKMTCLDKMFQPFVDWVYEQDWSDLEVDTVLWGEMAQNQNKLKYEQKHPFILFDSSTYKIDEWGETQHTFKDWKLTHALSTLLHIPMVPILYQGDGNNWSYEQLVELVSQPSYLGGCMEEGIVIKRYDALTKYDEPLFVKIVGAEFKEVMGVKTSPRTTMSVAQWATESFFNKPRLRKAIQQMREQGIWDPTNEKKNIGPLIGCVTQDIYREHYDAIAEEAARRSWKETGKLIASKVAPTLQEIILEQSEELTV